MNHCLRSRLAYKRLGWHLKRLTRQLCDKPTDTVQKEVKDREREYIPAGGQVRNVMDIMKEELKPAFRGEITSMELPIPRSTNILIIGGGLVGTAVAYFLTSQAVGMYDVTVIERDYAYTRASSMLSAGGVRHQFSVEENVQMSMFTTEFLKTYKENLSVYGQDPPEVSFHNHGYLFLSPPENVEYLEECVKMQRKEGAKTVMLSKSQLAEKYPWLNLEGIEAGSLGTSGEGWFDPWQLVHSLKAKNIASNVRYCEGDVVKFRFEEVERVQGNDIEMVKKMVGVDIDHKDGKRYGCNSSIIVNCAGPWAGEIARLAGIGAGERGNTVPLPVEPRKRYIYTIHCPTGPTLDTPMLIDPSGVYFRREGLGGHYICGASPSEDEEPDINDLNVDYEFFSNFIWPQLAHRVPAFNNSKLKAAWAGYYDYNTVDQNLIFGFHPYYTNFLFANGMSGHGVQQALAIGRAVHEILFYNEYRTIDMTKFGFDRFINNCPIVERAIV